MALIILIVAFISVAGTGTNMSSAAGVYDFLNKVASIYDGLSTVGVIIFIVGVVLLIVAVIARTEAGLGCGCIVVFVTLAVGLGIIIHGALIHIMIGAFSPTLGIVDPVKFGISGLIFLFLRWGG